ncbi:gamma-glutamyltransferase [Kiloniella laminariae]|uniref:Gamma-glutamyltransferase n=1 Tax=Kiloniella laminariae TaxID=454162 RepID=A0ABT4LEZ5_9PROT|nr:gamma-glutamyltransferase [Kiloniella laminariae]MCZ4279495.1 gamma-glutamyltransferase [Kiloniella laminariae]
MSAKESTHSGIAKFGAVACGHPDTAAAAEEILRDGGTAFDAALAALCASSVVEPVLSSFGGGGFLLAKGADNHQTLPGRSRLYDFFVDTPRHRRPLDQIDFTPITARFKTTEQEFHIGLGAMATPGQIRGLFTIHRELGSLPITRIMEPAIRLAREGTRLRQTEAYLFEIIQPIFLARAESQAIFAKRPDCLLQEGNLLQQPELAGFLDALSHEGERLFYEGEIASQLIRDCRDQGGLLTLSDLSGYQVKIRKPFSLTYRNWQIDTNPPPSAGGILIAFALALLQEESFAPSGFGTVSHLEKLSRIMALTNKARVESALHEAASEQEEKDAAQKLFSPPFLERYRREVAEHPHNPRGTTHISVLDSKGNLASLTLSNGEGCGYILPGSGIMMNNMLGEEDLNPAGFHNWPTGSRISSMMAPSLARGHQGQLAVLGSGGSNRIRTAILQVLINLIEYDMDAAAAVTAPRLHVERGLASIEGGFDADECKQFIATLLENKACSHRLWPGRDLFFGGVHTLSRTGSGQVSAAGDPRRGGIAKVI